MIQYHNFGCALALSADEKSENEFIPGFTITFPLSKCQNFRCFGVLLGCEFAAGKSVDNLKF